MPDLDDIFTGSTLKAGDLGDKDVTLTITGVEIKEYEEGSKPVLSFAGTQKTFVCNKTNANRIAEMHGRKNIDEAWVGKQITLYPDRVEFRGDMVDAIRVKILKGAKPKAAAKVKPDWHRGADEPLDDPIPF